MYIQHLSPTIPDDILERVRELHTPEPFPFSILATPHALKAMVAQLEDFIKNAQHIIFFGIGGSSLSGRIFAQTHQGIPITFVETVDADTLHAMAQRLEWSKTHCVFTSKSGGTTETMTQLEWIKNYIPSSQWHKQCLVLTQPSPSPLRTWAQDHSVSIINLDPHVPGRFSGFTATGLVPLICAGGSAVPVLEAAYSVYTRYITHPMDHDVHQSIAWILWNHHMKRHQSVLMPYAQSHFPITAWWRQLWAESLGKNNYDFTPIDAYGPMDQHSQLQLYLDGADTRFFTFIMPPPPTTSAPTVQKIGQLLINSAQATQQALLDTQRPVRTWSVAPQSQPMPFLASLMMHMFLETVLVARAYRIDPFNQPAVERIKQHLRTMEG